MIVIIISNNFKKIRLTKIINDLKLSLITLYFLYKKENTIKLLFTNRAPNATLKRKPLNSGGFFIHNLKN